MFSGHFHVHLKHLHRIYHFETEHSAKHCENLAHFMSISICYLPLAPITILAKFSKHLKYVFLGHFFRAHPTKNIICPFEMARSAEILGKFTIFDVYFFICPLKFLFTNFSFAPLFDSTIFSFAPL